VFYTSRFHLLQYNEDKEYHNSNLGNLKKETESDEKLSKYEENYGAYLISLFTNIELGEAGEISK